MSSLPKPFIALLAASLALNLFAVGSFVGGRLWHRPQREAHGGGDKLGVRAFLHRSGLDEGNAEVQRIIRDQRQSIRERARALGIARNQVRSALEADPFEPARLDTAISEVEARSLDTQRAMHGALSQIARVIEAGQRHKLADSLWPRPGRKGPPEF